ncbi:TetR/AcrR family transcriptional regulator [Duganella aceris]|nr:TetR/AcrR family transcriptional regulator [Duganella aceris]
MSRSSNREKILVEGMRVVLQHGLGGASVRDIVQAAGVPQGSFTNHFVSKEAFGRELLDIYFENIRSVIDDTLRNNAVRPLTGLRNFISANQMRLERDGMQNGCLSGNFSAEAIDQSEGIRLQLIVIFNEIRNSVAYCLRRAVREGAVPVDIACDDLAGAVVGGLQGAILLSKVQRNASAIEQFEYVLFSLVLQRPDLLTKSPT